MNIKSSISVLFVSAGICLASCGGSEKSAEPKITSHTVVFIDKSGSIGNNQAVVNSLLGDIQSLGAKDSDNLAIYPIHDNTSSADAFFNLTSKAKCDCKDLPTDKQNACETSCLLNKTKEAGQIKAKIAEIFAGNAGASSAGSDILGLIERSCSAFKACEADAKKQIFVYSDMLQESQRPQRDMSTPFASKDAALQAAKSDIAWLEANRTLDVNKLKGTKVKILTAYNPMNPPKGIAEVRDYWSAVFSHFGMEMQW